MRDFCAPARRSLKCASRSAVWFCGRHPESAVADEGPLLLFAVIFAAVFIESAMKETKLGVFDDLRESLQGALAFERREAIDLRVRELPSVPPKMRPRDIREIRRSLNASQVLFARFLNVSPNTIRSWEQGTRRPRGADPKPLSIAKKNPQALLSA